MALPEDDEIARLTMQSVRINTKITVLRAKLESLQQQLQDTYIDIEGRCEDLGYCFTCEEELAACRCPTFQAIASQNAVDGMCFCHECGRRRRESHGTIN